jgi:hypothetical protein
LISDRLRCGTLERRPGRCRPILVDWESTTLAELCVQHGAKKKKMKEIFVEFNFFKWSAIWPSSGRFDNSIVLTLNFQWDSLRHGGRDPVGC